MGGTIQELTIQNSEITVNTIKCTVDFKKFALYGILPSNNQAYWILAMYPRQATDHLVLRKPTTISFCTTHTVDIMYKLLKNDTICLSKFYDCAEIVRYLEMKRGEIPLEYFEEIILPVETTDSYLYKLKVRLIACNARSSYYKRKSLMVESNYLRHEFNVIRDTILAITYYKRLSYLMNIENFNELLPFQQLAARSWRAYLIEYLDVTHTILEVYETVRDTLKKSFDVLLEETKKFEDFSSETCLYCKNDIQLNTLTCSDKHDLPRCCVTLIQVMFLHNAFFYCKLIFVLFVKVPFLNKRSCRQCHAVALDDITKLQEATMMKMEEFYCPTCDIPLELNNSAFEYPF